MKKYLLASLLLLGLLPCFSNGLYYEDAGNTRFGGNAILNFNKGQCVYVGNNNDLEITEGNNTITNSGTYTLYCFSENGSIKNLGGTIFVRIFNLNNYITNSCVCTNYTSLECQTEYNLIPIESVDSNYCSNNNLCPSCPVCEEFSGTASNVYINDILHLGSPIIRMNIPQEIDWDYAYTNSGYTMNIDVVGYNQNSEYIDSLIDVNNYKPDSEDFSKVFGLFKEYSGLLISLLFVILVFYFVKKLF